MVFIVVIFSAGLDIVVNEAGSENVSPPVFTKPAVKIAVVKILSVVVLVHLACSTEDDELSLNN